MRKIREYEVTMYDSIIVQASNKEEAIEKGVDQMIDMADERGDYITKAKFIGWTEEEDEEDEEYDEEEAS